MFNTIPSPTISLFNLWPESQWCDVYGEEYHSEKDTIEKIELLVQSWKATAFKRNFGCEHVLKFHCQPSLFGKGHQLRFNNEENKPQGFDAQIHSLRASAMVEEGQCPQNTCISIHIKGVNLETASPFISHLSVQRYPKIAVTTYLK